MQQHPIPQNVTQYQFRLVGDMTLKQFLELALGLLLAYLFFASNLIFIFKWPLIILSILFGAGLAFFPIEDRPLDQWIINFLKAIYGPTRFIWKKSDKIPAIFTFTAHAPTPHNTVTKTIKAPTQNAGHTTISDLSETETTQVKSLDSLFAALPPAPTPPPSTMSHEPSIINKPTIAIRKLHDQNSVTPPPSKPVPSPTPVPQTARAKVSPDPIPQNLIYSQTATVHPSPKVDQITNKSALKSIHLPISPKLANLVVGVVTNKEGKLVENAIVQILDPSGVPARAIKTNALGQFATSTPLTPGSYTIDIEADGTIFTPQQLIINNSIIPPFEIRATN